MQFLKNILSTIIGVMIAFAIMSGVLFFFFILATATGENIVNIKSHSILELKLDRPLWDHIQDPGPWDEVFELDAPQIGVDQVIKAIESAALDERIEGILLDTEGLSGGFTQILRIRKALNKFKTSGKFVYSYGNYYSQGQYMLASVSDSIFLHPIGNLTFRGLAMELLYLKDIQDKSGIHMEVIRHGKYKSAVEPYLQQEMSDENREQLTALLTDLWQELAKTVGENRQLSTHQLDSIANGLLARHPDLAKAWGLVDGVIYPDEFEHKLKKASIKEKDEELSKVSLVDYSLGAAHRNAGGSDKIAVIYAQGEIIYGKGDDQVVGQELLNKSLKMAREDPQVKAIVLRVNSPGGSGLASELIWREIAITKTSKPVVVSMGDLAASGGYYISCNADYIYALPTTLTGSIGVFSIYPNLSDLGTKIGINAEHVTTHSQSLEYSLWEPPSEAFKAEATDATNRFYEHFIKRVAEGRKLAISEVDSIAQGRVWTGKRAVKLGLVDDYGDLEEAVAKAAELANVASYRIVNYPKVEKKWKDIISAGSFFEITSSEHFIEESMGEKAYKAFKFYQKAHQLKGVQARLPFELYIE